MNLSPNWLAVPVALPMLLAALSIAFARWGFRGAVRWQRILAWVAVAGNLAVAILILVYTLKGNRLALQMGSWDAPFGITVFADGFVRATGAKLLAPLDGKPLL